MLVLIILASFLSYEAKNTSLRSGFNQIKQINNREAFVSYKKMQVVFILPLLQNLTITSATEEILEDYKWLIIAAYIS